MLVPLRSSCLDKIYSFGDDVAVQLVAALLIDKATEVLCFAELRGTLCQVLEEALIRLIKALKHFLHGLTVKQAARDSLREKCLHP